MTKNSWFIVPERSSFSFSFVNKGGRCVEGNIKEFIGTVRAGEGMSELEMVLYVFTNAVGDEHSGDPIWLKSPDYFDDKGYAWFQMNSYHVPQKDKETLTVDLIIKGIKGLLDFKVERFEDMGKGLSSLKLSGKADRFKYQMGMADVDDSDMQITFDILLSLTNDPV